MKPFLWYPAEGQGELCFLTSPAPQRRSESRVSSQPAPVQLAELRALSLGQLLWLIKDRT